MLPGLLLVLLRRLRYRLFRRHSFNILDYGADPYGVLDSTNALQDAIDNSRYIEIPPGMFTISKSMNELLRPNTRLVGHGRNETIIHMDTPR